MKRLLIVLTFTAYVAGAQPRVSYVVSFENAIHHEAVVSVTFSGLSPGLLEARMSRTSPGRYALHEFAKNMYSVKAVDSKGTSLTITRPNPYQWDVAGHDGTVTLTYTVFGDHADGTYLGIDGTHAHINMPAAFMWARGLDNAPITITFRIPKGSGWKVATQLAPTKEAATFTAPGLQYFMDCPTELSNYSLREWKVSSNGDEKIFHLSVHHGGNEREVDAFAEMAKRIVVEEKAVFGELPTYDFGTYTFIADYLPYVYGDGMEHRNSTIIVGRRPLQTNAIGNLGTLAHEFFHSWNVERIRPKGLEPFNFEEVNMSGELWFAEGLTSYYGDLMMVRSGMRSLDRFAKGIGIDINAVIQLPGRGYFSAAEMSMQAPFVDAATSVDEQNKGNTFVSYYTFGEALAVALDLTLRTAFPGHSLDGFMRTVWIAHGKTEIPYTNEDLRKLLGSYTGDKGFADDFFRRYIYGHEVVDYKGLLAHAGLLLQNPKKGEAGLGRVHLTYRDGNAVISSGTLVGSPLYKSGLDRTDTLQTIDGVKIATQADYDSASARHKSGETVKITFKRRGTIQTSDITFAETDNQEVSPYETEGLIVTDAMKRFRDDWIRSRSVEHYLPLMKSCPVCHREFEFQFEFCSFDGNALQVVREE